MRVPGSFLASSGAPLAGFGGRLGGRLGAQVPLLETSRELLELLHFFSMGIDFASPRTCLGELLRIMKGSLKLLEASGALLEVP